MVDARTGAEICEQEAESVRRAVDMGKTKDERNRILVIIERHAQECEEGNQTLFFDAEDKTTGDELRRQAQRLRVLMREIKMSKSRDAGN